MTRPAPLSRPWAGPTLLALVPGPALAIEPGVATVVLPWGDALVAAAQTLTGLLLPIAIAAATGAVARIAGPLRVLVTTALVERLVRNAGDYAINAVAGAARGRTLTVAVGSAVLAAGMQRALDQAPAWLVAAAGGPTGLAEKIFRSLPLDAAADADNTLRPALDAAKPAS
ncbi:MAG TPA: hypothetical protein VF606_11555 [Geminicoccaceae bacterium]